MNRLRLIFVIGIALMIVVSACAPASTPTAAPTTAAPSSSSTNQPVDLAGPPMQVGSTYLYFDGTTVVAVPGGPFIMGKQGGTDNPVHTVTLSDFWIYAAKVTNQQYQYCVNMQKCDPPDLTDNQGYNDFTRSNDPVVGVNYADAAAYCDFAHGQLPTEAQWEKTARGPNGNIYPWGNNAPSRDLLNYNDYIGQTTNVTNYPQGKSYYDALDMEGNAYEWVSDWYDPLYYKTSPAQDPPGPGTGQDRSVRSAGYKSNDDQVPSSVRSHNDPTYHARDLGFRCVVTDPTYFAPFCQVLSFEGPNLSGTPGTTGTPLCPTLGVSVSYAGCGANAYAIVTFDDPFKLENNPDPEAKVKVGPGCTPTSPGGHFAKYICTKIPPGGFDVSITSKCLVLALGQTCPAHYNLTGNMCVWDGSGTQGLACLPGWTYDPSTMCCSSSNGTGTNFPACPVGTVLQENNGAYTCLPQQIAGHVNPASAHVDQPTNQCGSSGNPGSCTVGAACGAASTGHYNANCVCVP